VVRRWHNAASIGLYCVEIRTANWQASLQWYREVFGLRVLVRVVDDEYALLEAGETRISLLGRAQPGDPTRRISLAFEVEELNEIIHRLQQAGSTVSLPRKDREGLREASTNDPDGNPIRLFEWPRNSH
jgi:catechol 2,3-dioxygenase-like lactoylglutathione lyase family enzyme